METKVAVISIIVQDNKTADTLNAVLHDYSACIIGRMGLPYRQKGINIISIALDAPQDTIFALADKIAALPGVTVKTAIATID